MVGWAGEAEDRGARQALKTYKLMRPDMFEAEAQHHAASSGWLFRRVD